jgi:hypothetical protein
MTAHPQVAERPAYILSKMTRTFLFQLIALHVPPEKTQIVTMHPGVVYGDGWRAMGFPPDKFDSGEKILSVYCGTENIRFTTYANKTVWLVV